MKTTEPLSSIIMSSNLNEDTMADVVGLDILLHDHEQVNNNDDEGISLSDDSSEANALELFLHANGDDEQEESDDDCASYSNDSLCLPRMQGLRRLRRTGRHRISRHPSNDSYSNDSVEMTKARFSSRPLNTTRDYHFQTVVYLEPLQIDISSPSSADLKNLPIFPGAGAIAAPNLDTMKQTMISNSAA